MKQPVGRWADAHARSTAVALRYEDEIIDYRALAADVERLAHWLAQALPAGARIAWLTHNTPEQLIAVLACARAGCTLVPLNWRLTSRELEELLADAAPSLLVVDRHCAPLYTDAMRELCEGRVLSLRDPDSPFPDLRAAWRTATPARDLPEDAPDRPLLLVYTSGTTGRAKGSVLTQRAIAANAVNSHAMHAMSERDLVLTTLPLFHVGGLNIQTLPALALGATVLLHPRFDADATLAAIPRARPSLTVQVPATLQALLAHPQWATTPLASLRTIATGSTDVPVALIDAVHARGVPVIQVYGATETAPIAVYQRIDEAYATVGSIGRPAPATEIRLVDAQGREVGVDEPGEILVRGAQVASGYWRDEGASAETFAGGWFRSGDIATRDAAGRYWFRDRIKNVIISGGENVYPAEIERVARRERTLADCAVVGRPDARWGQVPVLFAVPADGGLDRAALQASFATALARYKHPRHIVEVDALPRTALGKIDVGTLRRLAAELQD
ncbi:MAG: class I adenylate-forming enzyme family protein [Gammaproteobacteria bacterium]